MKTPRFVIIGAGMAGILSAIKLREAGFTDVTIYEKADGLGGTWRENTYPGIACDVPSHLYSYSFAPNTEWSQFFSSGAEIRAYFENVAHSHQIDRSVQYGTEVTRLAFDDGKWRLTMAGGGQDAADIVIAATGVLHHPSYPDIEGVDTFGGPMFHSARWDHSVELAGCRLGVIGTGSSAVQIVSATTDTVAHMALFQRTAQWIVPAPNPFITEEQREQYRRDPALMAAARGELAQLFEEHFANAVVDADSPQMKMLEEICRANLEGSVADTVLRERLRPDYRAACKRLVISPDFYEKLQRPNAELIDERIERIEPGGIRTVDGRLHELDVLVLATGYQVDRFMRPMEILGRDGIALDTVWAERPSAYLSISIPQFPNLFMVNGPNGPVGNFSLVDVAELQFGYIMQLVEMLVNGGYQEVCATSRATERFEADRVEAAKRTVWMTGCRSWYLDDRGIPAAWPWGFDRFRHEMAQPDLADYELIAP